MESYFVVRCSSLSMLWRVTCLLGFAAGLTLTSAGQTTLPYQTKFDPPGFTTTGSLNNQQGWIVINGSAAVTNTVFLSGFNTQSVVLNGGSPAAQVGLSFAAPSPARQVMYADCLIKPAVGPYISSFVYIDTSLAVLICNGTQGQVFIFDGTNWIPTSAVFALNSDNATSSNWMRLTFRVDFTPKTWDLYCNGVFVAHDVAFVDKNATTLPFFISQGDPTLPGYLNYLSVGWINPLFADVNNDGIPDDWETAHGLSLSVNDRNLNPTGKGKVVLQDYIDGTDPNDYYSGVLPVLTSLVASSGAPGPQGLVQVKVTRASDGSVLANAPITLSVTTGASTISATTTPGSLTSVNVFTNSSGIASAYVIFNAFAPDVLTATAQSGSQTTSISINIIPSPTNITGMQLWLKADAGVAADMSTWADQSGNDNNATQANPSQRPTLVTNALNGLPVMHFDASQQQYLQLPNVMASATSPTGEATAGEIFMVVRSTGATGSLGGWGGIYGSYYPYNGNIYDDFGTNVWTSLGQPAQDITQYQLYNISSSSSEWTQRFNGLVNYDRLVNTVSFRASPVLGTSNNIFLSGDIAEIIVYNQVLTQAQRDTVNTYLGSKYNLYTAPPVPASLTATPLSPDQISLQWSAPPRGDHVSYLVERSTDGVSFIQVAAVRDSLSYIDTGLAPATTYTYRVRAQGYTGTSGYSNLASTITLLSKGGTDLPLIGMRLWLKADAGLSAGSGVNLWADQSGNDNNATQTIASQQPTLVANGLNGWPVVHFDASQNQWLNLPNVMASATSSTGEATAGEIFVVVRSTGTLGSLGGWGGASGSYYPYNGNIYDDFGTNVWTSLGQPAQDITQFLLYNVSSSSSEWTQRFNGLVNYDRLGNTVSFRASPVLGTSNNAYLSGDIAEIIVYDHVLNDQERETVGFYLNSKYAFAPLADFDNYRDGNYDGLPDSVDRLLGIDPTNLDDDGEGYSNLQLILAGYDPLDPLSIPPPPLPPIPGNPPPAITLTAPANAVPLP
jgi:hypothetical protein